MANFGEIGTAYIQIEPSAKGIQSSIEDAVKGSTGGVSKQIGNMLGGAAKIGGTALVAAGTAVAGVTKAAVESYASFEQLEGGIKTLFGDRDATLVMRNAEKAFGSAGMSANKYMETTIQSAAAMISSLEGDTKTAADLMDTSIIDMSDNVNKMGTTMEGVQNAYRGFSRGNFTMLDNLALGYSGTKQGMQELLDKANEINAAQGNITDYQIDSYADIVRAIHDVQTEMGITGTTQQEAGDTITGSMAAVKAAYENLMTSIASGDNATFNQYLNNLVDSIEATIPNLIPRIETAIKGVGTLIARVAPILAKELPGLVSELLPGLLDAARQMLEELTNSLPELMPTIAELLIYIANMIVEMLPTIVTSLVQGLNTIIPMLVEALPTVIIGLVQGLINCLPILIQGTVQLVTGLVAALPQIITQILEALPSLMGQLAVSLIQCTPQLIQANIDLIAGLVTALPEIVSGLLNKIPEVLGEIVVQIENSFGSFKECGKYLISGLWEGIKSKWNDMMNNIPSLTSKTVQKFQGGWKIKSPSRVFADEVGAYIPQGIAVGIEDNARSIYDAVDDVTTLDTAQTDFATTGDYAQSNGLYELLSQYLPMIANKDITLTGDAGKIFSVVRDQNNMYKKSNGQSAFA